MRSIKTKELLIICIFLLPFIPFVFNMVDFAFPLKSDFSDLTISHYPNAIFIRNSIINFHIIPLWSGTIFCGYPFHADPLTGYLYPPNWITYILPLPFGFNLLIFIHMFFGSIGLYQFLRLRGVKTWSAAVGGLCFGMMPKIWSHFAAGHISLVCAVCLTPWLLFQLEKLLDEKSKSSIFFTGLLFGGIVLADIRWAPYALLILISYSIFRLKCDIGKTSIKGQLKKITYALLCGIGISSALWIPLIQYSSMTTRSAMVLEDSLTFSLPLIKLVNLLLPNIGGNAEWVVYIGILPLLMFFISIFFNDKSTRYWLILGLCGLLLAISGEIPLVSNIWKLPLLNLLRVPARSVFLFGLSASIISPLILDRISGFPENRNQITYFNYLIFTFLVFSIFITIALFMIAPQRSFLFLWIDILIILSASLIYFVLLRKHKITNLLKWIFGSIIFIDLFIINYQSIRFLEDSLIKGEASDILTLIKKDGDLFRTYSPSYSIPQSVAALNGIEMADGVNPLSLAIYSQYMEKATGVEADGYSVTIPPFKTANISVDNKGAIPSGQLLGILNVKYLVSAFPIQATDLQLLSEADDQYLYENIRYYPRAWIQPEENITNGKILEVPELSVTPNKIIARTETSGVLVVSDIHYPGWNVFVDGKKAEILSIEGLLKGVSIHPGNHEVVFQYMPWLFFVSLGIAITFFVFCFVSLVLSRFQKVEL